MLAELALYAALSDNSWKWTMEDTLWEAAFIGAQVADWKQTRQLVVTPGLQETNKDLGPFPDAGKINRHFIRTTLMNMGVTIILPGKLRRIWQVYCVAFQISFIHKNYKLGVRVRL